MKEETTMTAGKEPGRRGWRLAVIGAALLALATGTVLLEDDGLVRHAISFQHAGDTVNGALILPTGVRKPRGCMVFVHGSGDMPRDAHGYYEPLWRFFADKGWCSLSWDKPGVGASGGDWRQQSMVDRGIEVSAAIDMLRAKGGFEETQIGLIGFSQAGWVMPKVANWRDDIAFMISVSGAVNWMEQSRYSGRRRMEAEGMTATEIEAEEEADGKVDALIRNDAPYREYLDHVAGTTGATPMSEAFWGFAKRNWRTDVREDLRRMDVPVLALFGSHDAYVDPVASAETYREELGRSQAPFFEIETIRNADHGMLETDEIKPAHRGLGAWLMLASVWFEGKEAFADGFFGTLAAWLERTADVRNGTDASRHPTHAVR